MEQNKNKIHFFKEKEWIMAWWYKRNRKCPITENNMLIQWNKWWKKDFINIKDERFQDAFKWVTETVNFMTMEEIKKKRYDIADTRPVPKSLQRMAIEKGYFIKKAAISKHPLTVSGYVICSSKGKRHNHVICGGKYNLTIKQVREFLETK